MKSCKFYGKDTQALGGVSVPSNTYLPMVYIVGNQLISDFLIAIGASLACLQESLLNTNTLYFGGSTCLINTETTPNTNVSCSLYTSPVPHCRQPALEYRMYHTEAKDEFMQYPVIRMCLCFPGLQNH